MESYVTSTGLMIQASCFLLAAFFVFLYRRKRQGYLLAWSAAWFLLALHCLFSALGVWLHGDEKWMGWLGALNESVFAFAALAFYCASRLYASLKVPKWVGAAGVVAVIWSVAHARYGVGVPAVVLGVGLIFLLVAHTFWHEGRKQEARADVLLGFTFAGWGLLCISVLLHSRYAFLRNVHLLPVTILPELFACVLMVMSVYEEERRRAERNMLALSNLNLVTGSFVGGEIQKMLAQALDRVLNVVRVPAGALCLQQGETSGTASVIVAGLNDSFSSAIQESELNEYFINLVARLGGLVVFRDLGRDASWKALEKDDAFRRIRQLLLDQGLRTIVGISLQAKERVFGVLLLGTPDNRNFTPAERRLLLALGQQIGMAVENSYLIRQTSRRSEELHILNEIGRALSSTLDPDKLLERIYSEMRRVVDAGSFFIAFHDQDTGEVRFEIEVVDGKRLPKRSRRGRQPAGGIRGPHRTAPSDSRALLRRSGAAWIRVPAAVRFDMRGPFDSLRSPRGCDGSPQPEGTRIRRRPRGVSARSGQRSGHRYRKRAAVRRRTKKVSPAYAHKQYFESRHHNSRSRGDAGENRGGDGEAPLLRPYRNRDSRLFGQGTRCPGRCGPAARSGWAPHSAGRRPDRPGCPHRADGNRPRSQCFDSTNGPARIRRRRLRCR